MSPVAVGYLGGHSLNDEGMIGSQLSVSEVRDLAIPPSQSGLQQTYLRAFTEALVAAVSPVIREEEIVIYHEPGMGDWTDFQEPLRRLIAQNCQVIASTDSYGTRAARNLELDHDGLTVPVVMTMTAYPLESGLVADLARPTKLTGIVASLDGEGQRRLDWMAQVAPGASSIAVLLNVHHEPSSARHWTELRSAMYELAWPDDSVVRFDYTTDQSLDAALTEIDTRRKMGEIKAMIVMNHPIANFNQFKLLKFARDRRLPTLYPFEEFVLYGGLMSWGPDRLGMYRSAGAMAGRILLDPSSPLPPLEAATHRLVFNRTVAEVWNAQAPPVEIPTGPDVLFVRHPMDDRGGWTSPAKFVEQA